MSALKEAINNDDPTILAKSRNTTCSRMLSSEDEGINFCQKSMFVGHKCDDVECCKCPFDTYAGGIAWLKKGVEMENNSSNVQEKPKDMFKKGDYIVVVKGNENNFKSNYCYKQRKDLDYCAPELDLSGSSNNGLETLSYCNTETYTWRRATPEEIKEYDRLGKPCDTTLLVTPVLVGDNSSSEVTDKQQADPSSCSELIVGRWYNGLGRHGDYYGKLCEGKYPFPCSEYMCKNGKYYSDGTHFDYFDKAELLTDLSEIQQYLPDGHVDKIEAPEEINEAIPANIPIAKIEVGKWYVATFKSDSYSYVFKAGEINDDATYSCEWKSIDADNLNHRDTSFLNSLYNFRPAIPSEYEKYLPSVDNLKIDDIKRRADEEFDRKNKTQFNKESFDSSKKDGIFVSSNKNKIDLSFKFKDKPSYKKEEFKKTERNINFNFRSDD